MKLAAIDIGTNSIHMIVVEARRGQSFQVVDREKEMVKLGVGVFATRELSPKAFEYGVDTIERYVQLADQLGVDDIITAATSAIREAHNGEAFLSTVAKRTGISPRIISGREEARLILLAVRNAIALQNETALVLDIGGGSTEAVVGTREDIHLGVSMPLGVQRLRDMFEAEQPLDADGRGALESYIRYQAVHQLEAARNLGFDRVIGTSGTIRTLGEAAHLAADGKPLQSVNAEVVKLSDIDQLVETLLELTESSRAAIPGISAKRADAIHLGGALLVQLLKLAEVDAITLCSASLREGLILDHLERNGDASTVAFEDLRHRTAAQLIKRYTADWETNNHVAWLSMRLFDQLRSLHKYGAYERELLEYGALLHDIGQYISFRGHHKNSRYILKKTLPRGFTDEETMLIGHLTRYHRKAPPTKAHKKFKQLSKPHRRLVQILSGILRIAIGLDKTKNQIVNALACQVAETTVTIVVSGSDAPELELWAANRDRAVLEAALERTINIVFQRDETKR